MRRVFELQASWREKNVSAIHYTVHYDPLVLPHLLGQKKAKIWNSRFLIENSYYIHAVSIWELKFYCKFSNLVNVSALLHRVIKSEFFEPKKFKFLKNYWFCYLDATSMRFHYFQSFLGCLPICQEDWNSFGRST